MDGGEDAMEEIARDRDLGASTQLWAILAISYRTTRSGSLDRERSHVARRDIVACGCACGSRGRQPSPRRNGEWEMTVRSQRRIRGQKWSQPVLVSTSG